MGTNMQDGVITERCYGCGRCFPVCPYDKISGNFSYSIRDSKFLTFSQLFISSVFTDNCHDFYSTFNIIHLSNWSRRGNICKRCCYNCWSREERRRWCYRDTYKWEVILLIMLVKLNFTGNYSLSVQVSWWPFWKFYYQVS